ncbi:hypothetical protein [Streptomyces sp. A012304]|uniref:hypothetical protein n=1 Tax=Streptomyces sp. A012304 TaxID=375446 RepID=UPI00222EC69F|nr:hypothetical protein [Streptomyces sp. A012304]GKQ37926.1 hypothetical protein ALMP_44610 [Streptomyces sp. A012304]
MTEPDQENAQSVERAGLVEVHEGDKVVPAPGSEAAVSARSGTEVHYYFPIHVVLTGDIGPETRKSIEDDIWDQLYHAFR